MFTAPLVALCLTAPGDTYTLEWKLREGDVFYNKTSVSMDQTIEVMGMQMDQSLTMTSVVRFKVKSVQPTVVEMTYLENKLDAAGIPGFNLGDKIKNVTFTATLDKNFKVTKFQGYDKFLEAVTDGDEEQKKLMKIMMPESTMRQMISQTFVLGPGKPVAVGDSWKTEDQMSIGPLGNLRLKQSLRLVSVKGNRADVSVKADLEFQLGDSDTGLPFKITKFDLKADKFEGTMVFDLKAGRVAEANMQMEMSGNMTIGIAGQTIDAKLVQKMKSVSTISDKNPVVD